MSAQARPQDYAAAIYDLAFESWFRQLESAQQALSRDAALRSYLQDTGRPAAERLQRLEQSMPGSLDSQVRRFLGTLVEAGQTDMLRAILAEFERLVRRRPERKPAQVVTAVPLDDSEKKAMEARLAEQFGADLEIEYKVDKSLIGGVYLRVGDRVIDGSVAAKLAALRESLAA
ncbi:MAG TPA: ATP synthase F1 subunit delta [Anaerolineae bacterium]|nr:ATP synthase F1 subunit delta [Anaerolineae bacterium]